ncbi:MAG: hypothetical protein AAFW73_20430 [Bacteroidota bacterium]
MKNSQSTGQPNLRDTPTPSEKVPGSGPVSYHTYNRTLLLLLLMVCSFSFGACSRYFYAPTSHGNLMLERKGDLRVSGGIGSSDVKKDGDWEKETQSRQIQYDLQLAYSPANRISLHLSSQAFHHNRMSGRTNTDHESRSDFFNLSIGYYSIFNSKGRDQPEERRWGLEHSLGFGRGNIRYHKAPEPGFELQFNKFFLQTHYRYCPNENVEFAFSLSPTLVDYRSITSVNEPDDYLEEVFTAIDRWRPLFFLETGTYLEIKHDPIRFFWSIRSTIPGSVLYFRSRRIDQLPLTSQVGIALNLNRIFTSKSSNN